MLLKYVSVNVHCSGFVTSCSSILLHSITLVLQTSEGETAVKWQQRASCTTEAAPLGFLTHFHPQSNLEIKHASFCRLHQKRKVKLMAPVCPMGSKWERTITAGKIQNGLIGRQIYTTSIVTFPDCHVLRTHWFAVWLRGGCHIKLICELLIPLLSKLRWLIKNPEVTCLWNNQRLFE